jgi:hypothetical protein
MDVTVGRFGSRTEAVMAKDLLHGAGIPTHVRADDAGALHPELGQVGSHSGITLVVADADADEARRFLAAYAADAPDEGSVPAEPGRRGLRIVAMVTAALVVASALAASVGEVLAVGG